MAKSKVFGWADEPKRPSSRPDAAAQQFNTPFKKLAELKATLPEQPKTATFVSNGALTINGKVLTDFAEEGPVVVEVREPGKIEDVVVEVKINV